MSVRSLNRERCVKGCGSGGFSLIELLITLALMIVLTTMMMSRYSSSFQQRQLTQCEKNLQSIHVAMSLHANDNKDVYPFVPAAKTSEEPLSLLVPKCTTRTEIFICPGTKEAKLPEGQPFAKGRISYSYYMGYTKDAKATDPVLSDRQVNTQPKHKGESLFSEDGKKPGDNHTKFGGNVVFADGHCESSRPKSAYELMFPSGVTLLNPQP